MRFKQMPGVAHAEVDYDSRKATVTYDPARQNLAAFEIAVTEAGYHVKREPVS